MSRSVVHDPTDWITASSIGPPGDRTFYVQSRRDGEYVALVAEKSQIRSLAELGQELLERVDITVTPDDVTGDQELHGPIQPLWRAGQMSLGLDPDDEMFVLEIVELVVEGDEEPATARFVMDLERMVGLVAFAAFAVEHGGRERCQVCEGLRDPLMGCMGCPLTNGSGPKRI
ncbi:hypothetical protein DVS28_a3929 [Euzebya pacifica]|uniref:DUF3090 family protein n=1 Tax=Euzebya pacifica TaxID=1608957 RepID=A0A346Y2A4_9ACTN|nr:DUF3090 family protein [Euzebya pacifica]AXV08601.1 hypothetical protein DVS28_a3929 [Euzebya pacifica]